MQRSEYRQQGLLENIYKTVITEIQNIFLFKCQYFIKLNKSCGNFIIAVFKGGSVIFLRSGTA